MYIEHLIQALLLAFQLLLLKTDSLRLMYVTYVKFIGMAIQPRSHLSSFYWVINDKYIPYFDGSQGLRLRLVTS